MRFIKAIFTIILVMGFCIPAYAAGRKFFGTFPKDNQKYFFGTGEDSSIYYDGTDLWIDAQEQGSGSLRLDTFSHTGPGPTHFTMNIASATNGYAASFTRGDGMNASWATLCTGAGGSFGSALGGSATLGGGEGGAFIGSLGDGVPAASFSISSTLIGKFGFWDYPPPYDSGLLATNGSGMFTNAGIFVADNSVGSVMTATLNFPGSGYTNGDIVTIDAGNSDATVQLTVVGGDVTGVTLVAAGTGYSDAANVSTSYGGAGSGCTVDITITKNIASLATGTNAIGATDGTNVTVLCDGTYSVNSSVGAINSTDGYYADGTAPVADGTYTVGIGGSQNGTITVKGGIITAIQEAN